MNKKLINLAVAAAMVAPAAVMADATMYGILHQSIDYIDQDDRVFFGGADVDPTGEGYLGLVPFLESEGGFSGWSVNRADGNLLNGYNGLTYLAGSSAANQLLITNWLVGTDIESSLPDDFFLTGNVAQKEADVQALASEVAIPVRDYLRSIGISNRPVGPSNRVGIKGSEDLGNGLKAIYQVEFGVRLSDGNLRAADGDQGSIVMRNSFVGVAGGFGTFLVGRHDTPLKISTGKLDMFADTMADYNGALGFDDKRTDNTVAYISPSWSGFQFAGAVHAGGTATVDQVKSNDSDSLAEAYSLAAIYSNGPWYAGAAYESLSSDLVGNESLYADNLFDANEAILDFNAEYGTSLNPLFNIKGFDDYTKWRIGLGILDWNGFSLTGIYEDRSNTNFVEDYDTTSWQIQAGYAFGNNMVKAAYGAQDRDLDNVLGPSADPREDNLLDDISGNNDVTQWTIAFDHNFSKRTKVYALYNNVDDDFLPDWDGFSLGLVHKF